MKKYFDIHVLMLLIFVFTATVGIAREYIVYSIVQDFPMGEDNEVIKKNYYVNIGKGQGVQSGTKLEVLRNISRVDPYETKKRYDYSVKIGEINIIHSEGDSAIGELVKLNTAINDPLFEIDSIMIGDKVQVQVK